MQAYWKMYQTQGMKVYLENGDVIDIFDDHTKKNFDRAMLGFANVISTYGIDTVNVEDPMLADPYIADYINSILAENYNYNKEVKFEVVK